MAKLSQAQLQEYQEAFQLFDKDDSGKISVGELREVLKSLGQNPTEQELKNMIQEVDQNNDDEIDLDEFIHMMTKQMANVTAREELLEAFRVFDRDGNGTISADELRQVMEDLGDSSLTKEQIEDMIKEADIDGDGEVNFEEFTQLFQA